jgi:hypothetical protein
MDKDGWPRIVWSYKTTRQRVKGRARKCQKEVSGAGTSIKWPSS